eukprot:m.157155 g.157155  ORF g.157155 m.157155 type:complete len:70 (-) comp15110_c0_seq1:1357-1566(-)
MFLLLFLEEEDKNCTIPLTLYTHNNSDKIDLIILMFKEFQIAQFKTVYQSETDSEGLSNLTMLLELKEN